MTLTPQNQAGAAPFDQAEFDAFLDDISCPFLTRKVSTWLGRMRLPFSMVTNEGPVLLSTAEEVQDSFGYYLIAVDAMHLDEVVRTPISFEVCDPKTVIVTYRTELLQNGKRQTDPYTSSALLHLTDDGWKMSSIMNARGHHPWTGLTPGSAGDKT